jgi:hypothetical protein
MPPAAGLERMMLTEALFIEGARARIIHSTADRMEEAMKNTLQQDLTQRLSDSVERLQQQADRVQYWASAITGLAQPVPDYEPESTAVARYIKSARPARKRRRRGAANQNQKGGAEESAETPARTKPASA